MGLSVGALEGVPVGAKVEEVAAVDSIVLPQVEEVVMLADVGAVA